MGAVLPVVPVRKYSAVYYLGERAYGMGHEVIVANARELRAISGSNSKHDAADAEKLATFPDITQRSSGFLYSGVLMSAYVAGSVLRFVHTDSDVRERL
jgi:hypothetical protein